MAPVQGPIVPRKRLGAELRRLREESDQTLEGVAKALLVSMSKLSRLENAQGSPQARDVRDLAVHYGVADKPLGRQLTQWANAGRKQGWWAKYDTVIGEGSLSFDTYLAYEADASIARVYTIPFVTGLLQTSDYTAELIRSMESHRTAEEISRFVEVRTRRQEALAKRSDRDPLRLETILHQSCLYQFVGSVPAMRGQLEYLLEAIQLPNVYLRVLPFSGRPHRMSSCTWTQFVFDGELDRDVVNIESHIGFLFLEKDDEVRLYDRAFADLRKISLDRSATQAAIEEAHVALGQR